jgi:uncharacterized membrane protein YkoI
MSRGAISRTLCLALMLPLLLLAVPAEAAKKDKSKRSDPDQSELREDVPGRCPGASLDEAIATAERRHKARVVKANVLQGGGRCVYELRLLSDEGRVWTIRVDSRTGD